MSDFNTFKLGDVAFISAGGDKPKIFSDVITEKCNIPVFANGETNNGLQGFTDKAKILEPAVTVSARGTIGFAVLRKEPFFPIVRLLTLLPKKEILDIGFLFYFLKLYRQNGIGSSQAQLIAPEIANRNILLPDLPTQQKIASVLSALDDKIELNNRINAELEAMVKTLYDYWFVQFDFPIVTSSGVEKPYKTSGGKMVYNETLKREIPEGWEVKKLYEIANITMGQSPNGESYNEENNGMIFFQGSTDFGWRFPTNRMYTTSPTRFAQEDDVLLSVRAPIGTMNIAMEDCCIGRGLAAINSKDGFSSYLTYQMNNFKKKFDYLNSVGTTFGSLTKDELYNLELPYPSESILKNFEAKIQIYDKKIKNNSKQNQELSALRDWLLPMLMNGQVKVE